MVGVDPCITCTLHGLASNSGGGDCTAYRGAGRSLSIAEFPCTSTTHHCVGNHPRCQLVLAEAIYIFFLLEGAFPLFIFCGVGRIHGPFQRFPQEPILDYKWIA